MPLINNAASYITLQITTRHQKLRRHFSFPKNCLHWARLPMWQRDVHSRVRKNHLEKQVVHSRITRCIPSTAYSFTTLKQEICTSNHCFNSIPKLVLHFKSPEPLKSLRHVGKQAWQKWKTRKMVSTANVELPLPPSWTDCPWLGGNRLHLMDSSTLLANLFQAKQIFPQHLSHWM